MHSLEARITKLENRTVEDSLPAIVINFLTPNGERDKPMVALYEPVSGAQWDRGDDETQEAFIDRASAEAKAQSRSIPLLFVAHPSSV